MNNPTIDKLSESCVTVALTIRKWGGEILDRPTTTEVEQAKSSESGWAKVTKSLASKDALKAFGSIKDQAYADHYRLTLPWSEGQQVIVKKQVEKYNEAMKLNQARYYLAREEFLARYDEIKAEAKAQSGGLYDEAQYPSLDQLREKFAFHWRFAPLPNNQILQDFAKDLGATVAAETEEHLIGMAHNTLRAIAEEAETLCHSVLAGIKADNGPAGKTVAAAQRLGAKILDLNWANDPDILAIAQSLIALPDAKQIKGDTINESCARIGTETALSKIQSIFANNPEYKIEF